MRGAAKGSRLDACRKGNIMQNSGTMPPIFVIVLDEVVVARDIELIIGDVRPDARIVVARTLSDAETHLPYGRIEAAFVQRDAVRFFASALGDRVAKDGGRLVLVEQVFDAATDGVSVLSFPFSREDVELLVLHEPQAR
jgi:hypothetical protein